MQEFRPPSVVRDDTDLAVALRAGDESALRDLADRFSGLIFTVVNLLLDDRARAEEATVETFVEAWRSIDGVEPGDDFAPWLATIARRVAAESADLGNRDEMAIETAWTVRRSIEALDPDEREVVRREHVEQLTDAEIAQQLDLEISVVDSKSVRAHRRLEQRLGHLGEVTVLDPDADSSDSQDADAGGTVSELLARPAIWEWPADDLVDRVMAAVVADARRAEGPSDAGDPDGVDGADVAPAASPRRVRTFRPAAVGAAAAIAVLFGAVVLLSALSGNPSQPDFTADMVPTGLLADVAGSIEVTARSSGVEIELDAPTLPRRADGQLYQAWLLLDDDLPVPVGSFNEGADITLWGGIELDRIAALNVTLADAAAAGDITQASQRVVLRVDFPTG